MKTLKLLIALVLLQSCFRPSNEELALNWIHNAPKPIKCSKLDTKDDTVLYYLYSKDSLNEYEYTTGYINMDLDTILY